MSNVPPRIYGLVATRAPIAAVFRRGPARWSHIGRWDLERGAYEPGAWLGGRIFPRRSDISPDGRYLCYFAHKPSARWQHGEAYVALSKLPWLTALHAFRTCGTWTRGFYFADEPAPDEEERDDLPIPWSLRSIPVVQFSNERRRGWEETPDSPPRDRGDVWDQRRNARLHRRQPRGEAVLGVESLGWSGGEFGVDQAIDGLRVQYWLEAGDRFEVLDDVQWADWDDRGRLLVATRSGHLQIRALEAAHTWRVLFTEDLTRYDPDPRAAPDWARRW